MGLNCSLTQLSADLAAHLIACGPDGPLPGPRLDLYPRLELYKAWAGIHYVLSGRTQLSGRAQLISDDPAPEHFILNGAQLHYFGEHAAVHSFEEVAEFASLLAMTTDQVLAERLSGPLDGVYGASEGLGYRKYVLSYLTKLREFVADSAKRGSGMITVIS